MFFFFTILVVLAVVELVGMLTLEDYLLKLDCSISYNPILIWFILNCDLFFFLGVSQVLWSSLCESFERPIPSQRARTSISYFSSSSVSYILVFFYALYFDIICSRISWIDFLCFVGLLALVNPTLDRFIGNLSDGFALKCKVVFVRFFEKLFSILNWFDPWSFYKQGKSFSLELIKGVLS